MPAILPAFLFSFTGIAGLIAALAAFHRVRPGKALPGALAVAGALIALWPGWQACLWMRGPVLDRAWQAGADRPASVRGVGAWAVGDDAETVVRARTDALIAYDSGTGDRAWVLRAPVRESVCAMSERTVDGIGLIAFARNEQPCDTVWGVDVRSGRKVWERNITGVTPGHHQGGGGLLSADAGVAVVLGEQAVHGYGLADGAVRWTAKPAPAAGTGADDVACEPVTASTAKGAGTVVVTCGDRGDFHSAFLLTLDTFTGRELSRRELPVESHPKAAVVLSAEPLTLLLEEQDERGLAAVLSHGDPGDPEREPVTIPLTADEEDLALTVSVPEFPARPVFRAVVAGGNLIVAAAKPGADSSGRVAAYSPADGRRRWHAGLGIDVTALAPAGPDRVAVLGGSHRLWTFAAGDGARVGEEGGTTVRDVSSLKLDSGPQLVRAGAGWVLVNADGDSCPPALGISP